MNCNVSLGNVHALGYRFLFDIYLLVPVAKTDDPTAIDVHMEECRNAIFEHCRNDAFVSLSDEFGDFSRFTNSLSDGIDIVHESAGKIKDFTNSSFEESFMNTIKNSGVVDFSIDQLEIIRFKMKYTTRPPFPTQATRFEEHAKFMRAALYNTYLEKPTIVKQIFDEIVESVGDGAICAGFCVIDNKIVACVRGDSIEEVYEYAHSVYIE